MMFLYLVIARIRNISLGDRLPDWEVDFNFKSGGSVWMEY